MSDRLQFQSGCYDASLIMSPTAVINKYIKFYNCNSLRHLYCFPCAAALPEHCINLRPCTKSKDKNNPLLFTHTMTCLLMNTEQSKSGMSEALYERSDVISPSYGAERKLCVSEARPGHLAHMWHSQNIFSIKISTLQARTLWSTLQTTPFRCDQWMLTMSLHCSSSVGCSHVCLQLLMFFMFWLAGWFHTYFKRFKHWKQHIFCCIYLSALHDNVRFSSQFTFV